jgi:hypothetical protein
LRVMTRHLAGRWTPSDGFILGLLCGLYPLAVIRNNSRLEYYHISDNTSAILATQLLQNSSGTELS